MVDANVKERKIHCVQAEDDFERKATSKDLSFIFYLTA